MPAPVEPVYIDPNKLTIEERYVRLKDFIAQEIIEMVWLTHPEIEPDNSERVAELANFLIHNNHPAPDLMTDLVTRIKHKLNVL